VRKCLLKCRESLIFFFCLLCKSAFSNILKIVDRRFGFITLVPILYVDVCEGEKKVSLLFYHLHRHKKKKKKKQSDGSNAEHLHSGAQQALHGAGICLVVG